MKKKLLLPIVSLLSLVAFAAPDTGNIYEIRPWYNEENVSGASYALTNCYMNVSTHAADEGYGTDSNPQKSGTFYFVVRLLNYGWSSSAPSATIPWAMPTYNDPISGLKIDPDTSPYKYYSAWFNYGPKIGIVVGGRTVYAKIVSVDSDDYLNQRTTKISTKAKYYTDLVCSYEIKPGDLALPVRLAADAKGKPLSSSSSIHFKDPSLWLFYSTNKTDTTQVNFKFIDTDSLEQSGDYTKATTYTSPDGFSPKEANSVSGRSNYDLSLSRINVQTLHFATNAYDAPLDGGTVTVVVDGTPAQGTASSLPKYYIWSETPGNADIDGTTSGSVYELQLGTATEYKIPVKGVTLGSSSVLKLSQYPKGTTFIGSDESYETTTLKATEPKANTLTVKGATSTATASEKTGDMYKASTKLDISLLSSCTNAAGLTVTLTPKLSGTHDSDDWLDYVRLSDKEYLSELPATAAANKRTFTIPYGAKEPTDTIYVFVLRSDDDNTTVTFDPDYAEKELQSLALKGGQSVSSLTLSATGGVTKGKTIEFKVAMTDAFADEKDTATGYSMNVVYDNGISSSSRQFNGLVLTNGMLRVKSGAKYELPSDTMPLSGTVTVTVTVKSPLSGEETTTSTTVSVSDFDVKATVGGSSNVVCAEGDSLPVTITLPTTYVKDLYAFLVCTNQDSAIAAKFTTNSFVVCSDTVSAEGIRIPAGQLTNKSKFTVLDNTPEDDTTWFFDVVVCTNKTYSPAAIYSDFTSTTLSLAPTNVAAVINHVVACETNANNDVIYSAEANASLGYVPEGKYRTFKLDVDDTAYDCSTNMVVKWSVYQTSTDTIPITNETFTVTNSLDDAKFTYHFPAATQNADANRYYIKVEVHDKDTEASGAAVSVNEITIRSKYSITVSASSQTIYENDEQAYITVGLNGWDNRNTSTDGLTVKVDVVPYKLGDPNQGVFELDWPDSLKETNGETNTYYVTFYGEGRQTLPVKSETLDGTKTSGGSSGGYRIYASVTNTVVLPTSGEAANTYYKPFNEVTQPQSVRVIKALSNVQPSFVMTNGRTTEPNSETNAWKVAGGSAQPIRWEITDCEADTIGSTNFVGLKVSFDGPIDNATNYYVCATNDNLFGLFRPDFGSLNGGKVSVNVYVEDKDGDMSETLTYWYEIQPAKFLTTAASGPSSGDSLIELSRIYRSQKGMGKGRTYVTGSGVSSSPTAKKFKLEWNCGTAYSVNLWAYGYRYGDVEGSLSFVDEGDVDLDESGNLWSSGNHYKYEPSDLRDSFFYGWIKPVTAGESEYQIAVSPEDGTFNVGDGALELPSELGGDEVGYKPTYAEAVFATEWEFHDNLGDIDQDGLPDIFALKTYKNGALSKTDGAGGELGSGAAGNNDDGDFYPSASHLGDSPLLPGATSGWATSGTAFDAMREIRGYDDGLNYGMFRVNTAERDAGWVSELSLSDNEKRSLVNHALVRRDAILHQRHYEKEMDKYWEDDLKAITNLLRTLVRAGTTRESGTARPAFYTDDELRGGTVPGATWEVVTNTVEKWGTSWEEENTALIYTYTNASKVAVTITNVVHAITNIIDEATTNCYDASNINPFDYITLDDINFGDFLSTRSGKPLNGDDYAAARAYIVQTWHLYDEYGTWGWTCENRTDPTTDDTDGDGMPDGYEYFFWYDAVVGINGTNRLVGCKFNLLKPDSRDDVIPSKKISELYNPNIKRSWTGSDTDGDGVADLEEFLIGTSPVDWDTDLDGVSDFYELAYNLNPLSAPSARDGSSNNDGDYMAYVKCSPGLLDSTVPKMDDFRSLTNCTYIFTATNGTLYMLDYDATPDIWAALRADPETNAVPVVANGFEVAEFCGNYIPTTENTASLRPVSQSIIVDPLIPVITNMVSLYHHQVHNFFGFDPRTAWFRDPVTGNSSGRFGEMYGNAVNTTAFTAKDEYMLLRYRYLVGLRDHAKDVEDIGAGKTSIRNVIVYGTTNPNPSFEAKTWGDSETKYTQSHHGGDTDGDAVPDGWELYIGVNPNKNYTIQKGSSGYDELYWDAGSVWPAIGANEDYNDGLSFAMEFAGTDTCGAYSGCPTIYANHPDNDDSAIKGWVNKYMPTDPRNKDTDGDGLDDGKEGSNWTGDYVINRWGQDNNRSKNTTTFNDIQYFIIYGNPKSAPSTSCVRGGGFNPCTIDTDGDGLPDKWERENAGLLFLNDEIATEDNSGKGVYVFPPEHGLPNAAVYDDIRAAVSALGWDRSIYTNDVYHIIMGMDGTTADAYTKTGLKNHDLDWDGDGLQNWQEYMVQAMRQFRYDDDRTPLMGRDIPKFNPATGKMELGSWNGDKGYLQISRAQPVTTDQHTALKELGYSNFVDYLSDPDNADYLRTLGYFAEPPMKWDQASGGLYMLPPSCSRIAGVSHSQITTHTPVSDGLGNTVWGYAKSDEDYDFTIEELDYLAIGWPTVTNTTGSVSDYDPALGILAYTDGQVLLHTNDTPYYVVVNTAVPTLYKVRQLVNSTTTDIYTPSSNVTYTAGRYVGTDPRLWDTDEDGMDDYWELFHGLNPILGYVGDGNGTVVSNDTFSMSIFTLSNAKDVIYSAYGSVNAWQNGWIGWDNTERPTYDPIRYPWMMGEGLCDADGDGFRNEEEALTANLTKPFTYHTDPTPLWMTDTTGAYTNRSGHYIYDVVVTNGDVEVSYFDPSSIGKSSWSVVTNTITNATASVRLMLSPSYTGLFYDYAAVFGGAVKGAATGSRFSFTSSEYAFSFEQNEGYDTDNDWRSDSIETKNTVEGTSDPLDVGDVPRRQSLWFGGSAKPGAAISYTPTVRNVHSYDLFRQFTVEAWVRSENPVSSADQYIVSRASYYPGWDVEHTNDLIRMNFALGVNSNGCAFAEMQDSTETTFRLEGDALSPSVWTHLAASYDGSTFTVYINGKVSASIAAILIPANGVSSIQQDPQYSGAFPYEEYTYNVTPSITILGARACGEGAFSVNDAAAVTGWDEVATNFFCGSVAEVRMWDGARKAKDIANDFDVRYTTAQVKALRDTVCAQYINGARRNTGELDPELVQHYGMDSLPGGTDEKFVQLVPAGFKANVLDAVRNPETGAITTGDELAIGWWSAIVTNATLKPVVYSSPHVVPWVENTIGHLPKTCGTVADSVYWSEHFAGYTPAAFHKLEKYSFSNTMNPYGIVNLRDEARYTYQKYNKLISYPGGGATSDDNRAVYRLERYDSNKGFSGTTDLVPLGSAFAKRLDESWDGQGAEDAWAITTSGSGELDGDPNDTGKPDWASAYTSTLEYLRELAKGRLPDGTVDPKYVNTADVDRDGMPDWWEKYYKVYSDGADDDTDRDGLSNYQEYLISEFYTNLVPHVTLNPTNANSVSKAVPDYFLRHKKLYYGELFADHDHIEDWWENEQPSVITRGGTVLANYSSFVYDANTDVLGEGWDNWSLARAWFDGAYTTNIVKTVTDVETGLSVVVTNTTVSSTLVDNGGVPSPAIPVRVTYHGQLGNLGNKATKYQVVVKAWSMENGNDPYMLGSPDKTWGMSVPSQNTLDVEGIAVGFSAEGGSVRPGRNMFVSYIAEGEFEEGSPAPAYEPGMPYGVASGVVVGPLSGADVNIELTDVNYAMPRIDIAKAIQMQDVYAETIGSGAEDRQACFDEMSEACTDRGRYAKDLLAVANPYVGTDMHGASSNEVRQVMVRIIRSGINDEFSNGDLSLCGTDALITRTFPLETHNVLTEADLLADPELGYDIDWGGPRQLFYDNNEFWPDITNAYYRIVLFDGTIDNAKDNNNLCVMFVNRFENLGEGNLWQQTPVTNMEVRTYSGQPTFSWRHPNSIDKAYPAFQLRVWDGTACVFDSGVQRAPVRDASGRYNWTAPLWVGSITSFNKVFEGNKKYTWSVSMLDAKFIEPASNESKAEFSMQETSPSGGSSDYGIIPVTVKYLGPGTVDVSTNYTKCLRVEAFRTKDFVGMPSGVGFVYDDTNLGSIATNTVNAVVYGLPANKSYYVRAYIDTNGNGALDAWESWGYACYRGSTDRDDFFTPRAVMAANAAKVDDCTIYVEDSDTNHNMVPDILEKEAAGGTFANKLLSPYIAYGKHNEAAKIAAVDDATVGANGNEKTLRAAPRKMFAYATALNAMSSDYVTPGLYAVATGELSIETEDSAHIKITSFSLETGITLDVVVDGSFEEATTAGFDTGYIKVGVEYATTLENGGNWKGVGMPDTISFPLTPGTTTVEADSLSGVKAAIESVKKEQSGSCYFRVSVVAFE